jgi:hypothetical protein
MAEATVIAQRRSKFMFGDFTKHQPVLAIENLKPHVIGQSNVPQLYCAVLVMLACLVNVTASVRATQF